MTLAALSALIIIGIGVLLRQLGVMKREHAPILVQATLYVLLPALVLDIMIGAKLDWGLILVPFVSYAVTAVMTPFAIIFARMMRLGRAATGGVILMIAVANTGFFGLPLLREEDGMHVILAMPRLAERQPPRVWINAVLFGLTVITVLFAGAGMEPEFARSLEIGRAHV